MSQASKLSHLLSTSSAPPRAKRVRRRTQSSFRLRIPAKDVGRIAAHVLRARIAQAGNDLDGAIRELQAAVEIQDTLPYMEPPYWYYPLRQTLGALLLLKGDTQAARDAFRESLARTPNNAWSLYGLKTTFERQGMVTEAREAEKYLARAWSGDRKRLDLQRL